MVRTRIRLYSNDEMRLMKLRSVALCLSELTFCFAVTAQTKTNTQEPATENQTIVNPNATQFPHNSVAPPPAVVPPTTEKPSLWESYDTHFAAEFGGRALSNTGNADVY